MGNLSPVRLVFRQSGDDLLLAAEEAHDRSVGIVVSRDVQGLLEEMLPTSGPRFLAFWQSYEDSRGGGAVFFSELAELLGLIARHPELRVLPKLTAVRQAEQLFHDVIVAKVFTIAAEAGLRPALVPTAPPIRTRSRDRWRRASDGDRSEGCHGRHRH